MRLEGGRGEYVWYSSNDYEVEKLFQDGNGRTSEGACSQNVSTMFHIIVQDRQVTIVVDDPLCPVCRNVIGASIEFARDLSLLRGESFKACRLRESGCNLNMGSHSR